MVRKSPKRDTRGKTYVLQEGRYDDIAAVEVPIEQIDSGDPRLVGVEFPCVVAAADPGTVRTLVRGEGDQAHAARLLRRSGGPHYRARHRTEARSVREEVAGLTPARWRAAS
jgi:hypothetical protein